MTGIQTFLLTGLLAAWLGLSIVLVIEAIQSTIYSRRNEKRTAEREARELEYHIKLMKDITKK